VAVTGINPAVLLDKLHDGEIGQHGAVWVTAAIEPDAVRTGERLTKLMQQARFAQPGVANDRDSLATPLLDKGKTVMERRQFTLPPYQAREAPLMRHVNTRAVAWLTRHAVDAHFSSQALEADQSHVVTVKVASHQFVGVFRELDRAR